MKQSTIYIGIKSVNNFDFAALNDHLNKGIVTKCVIVLSKYVNLGDIPELNANVDYLIRDENSVVTNVIISAVEDANIAVVDEMTFVDKRIFNDLKPYLEQLGITASFLKCNVDNERNVKNRTKLRSAPKISVSQRKSLNAKIIERFREIDPVSDSIQYCKLCINGFSEELNIRKLGYKRLVDLIEDLNYFIVERDPSSITISFPSSKNN